jgi:TetR/AcrR family transcriptional regulator, regulator of cefoperazone and chloramphenicol sensitivity
MDFIYHKLREKAVEKILLAAGEIFAEKGYKNVTVREICARAGVNVAAINYHFGDKESLYKEVVMRWEKEAFSKYPLKPDAAETASPEERLTIFVRFFLLRMLDEGRPSWFGKLVAREFIEPTAAMDILVEDAIRPSYLLLSSIVRDIIGKGASEEGIRLCSASIVGQCLYFHNSRPVLKALYGPDKLDITDIEKIAEHIARFSIAAMRAMAFKK